MGGVCRGSVVGRVGEVCRGSVVGRVGGVCRGVWWVEWVGCVGECGG